MTPRFRRAVRGLGLHFTFWQEFLRRPRDVASVVSSSRYLEQRLVEIAEVRQARFIVELGPGTGGTTRAFLGAMDHAASLLAIELIPSLAQRLATIGDRRLTVAEADAARLRSILSERNLPRPDRIIWGIPFSAMPLGTGRQLMEEIRELLAPGGSFVAYQFRDAIARTGEAYFGPSETFREFRNLPPLWIYRWRKDDDERRVRTTSLSESRLSRPVAHATAGQDDALERFPSRCGGMQSVGSGAAGRTD